MPISFIHDVGIENLEDLGYKDEEDPMLDPEDPMI